MFKNRIYFAYLILFVIFLVAFLLRFYRLNEFPVGFHIDEASLGYNGYSLLLTGKDDNGNFFPLYIDMFGDNRPSGYHYLTIIPIMLFGLTEFATRFSGAFFGALTIFSIYFLVYAIFENRKISIVSALLLAIAPWHITLSRASSEAIVALFLVILGFGSLVLGHKRQQYIWAIVGVISLTASFFFYHTPRVFVPLLFLVLLILFFILGKNYKNKLWPFFVGCLIFIVIISAWLVFSIPGGTGRFNQINIFNSFETNFFQEQQIREDAKAGSNHIESRFFHNKISNVMLIFISNYFDYFGLNFLFAEGGLPIWYSIPRVGLLYLVELPFIIIGIYYLIKEKNTYSKIPLVWVLIAPIVPAITMDDVPNINRSVALFPMLNIIASIGFFSFIKDIKYKKQISIMIGVLLLVNTFYFLHQYFYNAKTHKPWYRNNGFSEMMSVVNKNYQSNDAVIMSKFQGGIYPLVLFYSKYNPKIYQEEGSTKNADYTGFGKFFFVPQDCPSVQRNNKSPKVNNILFVDKGDCPSDKSLKFKKIKYIYREDGTKAFRLVYD
ncbi:MAG: glycosyltransferase family 39 protein [Candidatus Levybacteria bacterium]|nr:glycosyltransferase family 39 protein [Candidatus Levybacteria bacterium]